MKMLLAVALGGAGGALARYGVGAAVGRWLGTEFPYAVLVVNVAGSFVMGLLAAFWAHVGSPTPALRALLAVGFLGAFTTFSTFSLDVALLMERGQVGAAALYALSSVVLSVGALFAGLALVRTVAA